ncbi:AraC family transcriptional regulator [Bifidobacterium sp. ESL0728]|uniref:AraC family transcriptional regulator n=1 Tax=Bifidobacterium sp. ESL0728 TaxID=2983220 RepID=UPI0023F77809|nr:AraC family transcriptional regulator [Bifidobacterium sp. ESL0728]WEV58653.1 AraC family transcriptional regulator [Bifidobacterium sp. ESL0728]
MTLSSSKPTYNTVITSDYLEEDVYPEESPALVIIHDSNHEYVHPHWHRGLEIVHSDTGPARFTVDNKVYDIESGDTLIISPYDLHHALIDSPYRGISVTFNGDTIAKLYPFADRYRFSWTAPNASDNDRASLVALLTRIMELSNHQARDRSFLINAALYEMLSLLYTRFTCGIRRPEEIRRGRNIIMEIIGYLNKHYTEPLTETFVAQQFSYSREHFSRLFKRATGNSFKEYLTELRCEDAHAKLLNSKSSVAEISQATGFPSAKSLNDAFRKRYGISPREYRAMHHTKNAAGVSGSAQSTRQRRNA